MPKNHKKDCTSSDEKKLKSLINRKKTTYEITVIMGRTQTAIISKIKGNMVFHLDYIWASVRVFFLDCSRTSLLNGLRGNKKIRLMTLLKNYRRDAIFCVSVISFFM